MIFSGGPQCGLLLKIKYKKQERKPTPFTSRIEAACGRPTGRKVHVYVSLAYTELLASGQFKSSQERKEIRPTNDREDSFIWFNPIDIIFIIIGARMHDIYVSQSHACMFINYLMYNISFIMSQLFPTATSTCGLHCIACHDY